MIPDLSSPYLSNGPLSPGGARTVSVSPAVRGPVGVRLGGMRPRAFRGVGDGASCLSHPGPNLFAESNSPVAA